MLSKYGMKTYIKYDKRCFIISSIKFNLQELDLRLARYIVYVLLSYKGKVWIKSRSVSVTDERSKGQLTVITFTSGTCCCANQHPASVCIPLPQGSCCY